MTLYLCYELCLLVTELKTSLSLSSAHSSYLIAWSAILSDIRIVFLMVSFDLMIYDLFIIRSSIVRRSLYALYALSILSQAIL